MDRIFTAPGNLVKWFFWLILDDSIKMEFDLEYCPTAKKMSAWVEKLPKGKFKEFARSYYWSAWRNNGINLSWMLCFGEWTQKIFHYGGGFTYYRLLRYGKWALPQLQYTGLYRFQAGWLTNGKFEIGLTRYNV